MGTTPHSQVIYIRVMSKDRLPEDFSMLNRTILLSAIFSAALGLVSCNGDNNPIPSGNMRVANAIANSQPVDAAIEGIPDNIENIAFGTASGERDIVEGNYRVTLSTNTNNNTISFN